MTSVTVPGTTGIDSPVTVSTGTGDVLQLAQTIGNLLGYINTVNGGGGLVVSQQLAANGPLLGPSVPLPTLNELILTGTGTASTIPSGYNYVANTESSPATITGSNLTLITGTAGGSYNVSGLSTVAAEGGNNFITASGQYLISTEPGNNTISASGQGTIATDAGSNLISVSGLNLVNTIGDDTVFVGTGVNTVTAAGPAFIVGSSNGQSLLSVSTTGANATVSAATSDTSVTTAGSDGWVFGGQTDAGTLAVLDMGSNDSVVGLSSPTTVTAGAGSNGLFVFGGAGNLTFVGGSSAATVLSGSGTNSIVGGTGGILVGAYNNSTVTGQAPGGATVFGTAGHDVTYLGGGTLLFAAGAGSETLNAAQSTGTNDLFAVGSASVSVAGGAGTNLFDAGSGSDTFTGGTGHNTYFFLAANTAGAGAHDYITNLASTDAVGLIGYNSAGSSISVANGSATLTLSDKTEITFVNVTNITNNIHYGS